MFDEQTERRLLKRQRIASALGCALIIAAGLALSQKWEPWAAIVGVFVLVGWIFLIADLALKLRDRHRARR